MDSRLSSRKIRLYTWQDRDGVELTVQLVRDIKTVMFREGGGKYTDGGKRRKAGGGLLIKTIFRS